MSASSREAPEHPHRPGRWSLLAVGLVVLTACSGAAGVAGDRAAAGTRTHRFDAATVTGSVPSARGHCFFSSLTAPARTDAWRCASGAQLLDPCFTLPAHPDELLCALTPEGPFTRLTLTAPLPSRTATTDASPAPWAIRLADGPVCVAVGGGTVPMLDGEPLSYVCGTVGSAGQVFGPVHAADSGRLVVDYVAVGSATARPTPVTDTWS